MRARCDPKTVDLSIKVPTVDVVIEIPRGSFIKWGAGGYLDFISPLPCPFNYGSIESHIGGDGDLLDAVVLGASRRRGSQVTVKAYGAVTLSERGMQDDKLICSTKPLTPTQRHAILLFFNFYGKCKSVLNFFRFPGLPGRVRCKGWDDALAAIARARPR